MKAMNQKLLISGIAIACAFGRLDAGQTPITLTVTAHMDPHRALGYNDGSDGVAPAVYTFAARAHQALTFTSVKGKWTYYVSGGVYFGPDGEDTHGDDYPNPVGPFSGYMTTDFNGAMMGMFTEDTLPKSAPPPLRFYKKDSSQGGIRTDFQTLSPLIGQLFFIGDGLTGTATAAPKCFECRLPQLICT